MGMRRILIALAIFGPAPAGPAAAAAAEQAASAPPESAQWEFGAGAIDSYQTDTFALVFVRHHFAWNWHGLRVWTGGSVVEKGAFWVGGGLRFDFRIHEDWHICLASGPGYFNESDELDLGHEVEFNSTIELARTIGDAREIVAGIGHISNAGLGDYNPGATTYRLSFRWDY